MSYSEASDDLNTPLSELVNLMTDTFTCCMRNYETLLPSLKKKETHYFKIYHKLVQVNLLVNKLNVELVKLIAEYVINLPHEQKTVNFLSEEDRKRRLSDVSEAAGHESKRAKTEESFSSSTSLHSENLVLIGTEETSHSQLQSMDMRSVKNIKTEIQDSNEVENVFVLPVSNSEIHVAQKPFNALVENLDMHWKNNINKELQDLSEIKGLIEFLIVNSEFSVAQKSCDDALVQKNMNKDDLNEIESLLEFLVVNSEFSIAQKLCDTTSSAVTVYFSSDEERESVADRLAGGKAFDKCADSITRRGNNERGVPLESVGSETINQGECGDSDNVLSEDQAKRLFDSKQAITTCNKESALLIGGRAKGCNKAKKRSPPPPIRYEKDDGDAAVKRLEELYSVYDELYGITRHKKKKFKCTLCKCVIGNCETVHAHVKGKKHQKKLITARMNISATLSDIPDNICGTAASVSVCGDVFCSLADTVPAKMCESVESECSAVPCALADTVAVVENRHQAITIKHAVKLDSIWTYFDAPFHINKKFFRFHSGQLICSICYEQVGRFILNIKIHISKLSHLDRINILRNIELKNKSSNVQLLDIPDILKNIVPTAEFSLRNNGFFCKVCNCFCESMVVLNHMTSATHAQKLDELKKISIEPLTMPV